MYHALPSFSARGAIVGLDDLIMGHYAPIAAQRKPDRMGRMAFRDAACSPLAETGRPKACTRIRRATHVSAG